jgi:hypothetical protein
MVASIRALGLGEWLYIQNELVDLVFGCLIHEGIFIR